jgi:hypothetical protein
MSPPSQPPGLRHYAEAPTAPAGSRLRKWLPVGAAAALALAFVGPVLAPGPRAPRPIASQARPTPASAVAAATAYATAFDHRVMLDRRRLRAAVARFAAPAAIPLLTAQLTDGLDALRASVAAGHVVSVPALLGYRVNRFTPPRASISVWGVLLFGTAIERPRSLWRTSTVELVWRDDRWWVTRHVGRDGPSAAWPIDRLATTAATFRRYRDAQ